MRLVKLTSLLMIATLVLQQVSLVLAGYVSDDVSITAGAKVEKVSARFTPGNPEVNEQRKRKELIYKYPPTPGWAGNWRHYRIANTASYGLEVYTHYIYLANTRAEASVPTRGLSDYLGTSALSPSGNPNRKGLIYYRKPGAWDWSGGEEDTVMAYAYAEGFPNRAGARASISAEKKGPYTDWVRFGYRIEGPVTADQLMHPPRLSYPSGVSQPSPGVVELWDGVYSVSAECAVPFKKPAAGGSTGQPTRPEVEKRHKVVFDHWEASGNVAVADPYSPSTSVRVNGDGTLTAVYVPDWWRMSRADVPFKNEAGVNATDWGFVDLFKYSVPVYTPGGEEADMVGVSEVKELVASGNNSSIDFNCTSTIAPGSIGGLRSYVVHIESEPAGAPVTIYMEPAAGERWMWEDRAPRDLVNTVPFAYGVRFAEEFKVGNLTYTFDHLEVDGRVYGATSWSGSLDDEHTEETVVAVYRAPEPPSLSGPSSSKEGAGGASTPSEGGSKGGSVIVPPPPPGVGYRYRPVYLTVISSPVKGAEVRAVYQGTLDGYPVSGVITGRTDFTKQVMVVGRSDAVWIGGAVNPIFEEGGYWWPAPGAFTTVLNYYHNSETVNVKMTWIPTNLGSSGGTRVGGGGKPKLPEVNGGYTGYSPAEVLYSGKAKWDYHHRYFVKSVELHAYYCDALGRVLDAKTPDKLMPLEYFMVKAKVHVAEVVTASPNGRGRHLYYPAELWLNVTGPGDWTKLLESYSPSHPRIREGDTTRSVHLTGLRSDREVTLGVWIVRNMSSAGWDRPFKDLPLRVAYRWNNTWGDGASFEGEHFVRVCRAMPVLVSEPEGDLIKLKVYLLWRDTLDYVVGREYVRFKLVGPRTIELPDAKLDPQGRTVVEGEVGDLAVPIGGADFILKAVAPHGFVDRVAVRASQLAVVVYERGPEAVKLKLVRLDDLAPVEGRLALITGGGNHTKACDGQGYAEWRRGELGLGGAYRLYAAGWAGGVNRIYVAGPYAKVLLEANPPVPGQPFAVYEKLKAALHRKNPLAPLMGLGKRRHHEGGWDHGAGVGGGCVDYIILDNGTLVPVPCAPSTSGMPEKP